MTTAPAHPIQVPTDLEARILDLYDPALPYHNAEHALTVRDRARHLACRLRAAGEILDLRVVELAALLHDAGYRTAPATATREAYAAHLADQVLTAAGYEPSLVDAVNGCVLATEAERAPVTPEEYVVRAADLLGIGSSFESFAADNALLREETGLLTGNVPTSALWAAGTAQAVGRYLATDRHRFEDLAARGALEAGGWAERASSNVLRLLADVA